MDEIEEKGEKIMPFIRQRRIRWEPVSEATSYGVYIGADKTIFNPEKFMWRSTPGILFKFLKGKTELILPDEWPEFPEEPGTYYIGITSIDDVGNESDPFLSPGLFKFIPPPTPLKGGIEVL